MARKALNMHHPNLARMTLVKEPAVAFNSIQMRLLDADQVVQRPDARTHRVQQAQRDGCGRCLIGRSDGGDGFHCFLVTMKIDVYEHSQ
jgi:hypothetical protein